MNIETDDAPASGLSTTLPPNPPVVASAPMAWTTAGNTFHVALSVRGALRNASRRELGTLFTKGRNGRRLTADEAKDVLLDYLANGHEVIPLAQACEGFDYAGGGCPGHSTAITLANVTPPRDLRTQLRADQEECANG